MIPFLGYAPDLGEPFELATTPLRNALLGLRLRLFL